jgi:hypothetical protein
VGRATRSARLASHVDLLGYGQSIINLDTKIANRALDLGMAEQQLDGPQIAGTAIGYGGLGPTQRMRTEEALVEPDSAYPIADETRILSDRECPA